MYMTCEIIWGNNSSSKSAFFESFDTHPPSRFCCSLSTGVPVSATDEALFICYSVSSHWWALHSWRSRSPDFAAYLFLVHLNSAHHAVHVVLLVTTIRVLKLLIVFGFFSYHELYSDRGPTDPGHLPVRGAQGIRFAQSRLARNFSLFGFCDQHFVSPEPNLAKCSSMWSRLSINWIFPGIKSSIYLCLNSLLI